MGQYREVNPAAQMSGLVECFWISSTLAETTHRVMPDGCADIIYTRHEGRSQLRFVGPMKRYEDFAQPGLSISVGMRFRPAMWRHTLGIDGLEAADLIVELDQILGKPACQLRRRLDHADTESAQVEILAGAVRPVSGKRSPIQQAVGVLERHHGQCSIGELANAAGICERQFRRRCIEESALSPKLLARIFRFRRAQRLLLAQDPLADIASACGYFDQSHLSAEFRQFSGRTPRAYRPNYLGDHCSSADGP